jgi:hypothetical protein
MERDAARRSNVGAIITTLLSLLVVVAAVAVVAYFVLRAPSTAVDSAERLDPVGTALPAPTEPPSLPTPIPTTEPEPTVLGFTGEEPANSGLPTVAAPTAPPTQATGPTPTPRVLSLPTEVPATAPPPPPTLPPAQATSVPVVALAPVEAAPPPTVAPQEVATGPTPTPAPVDTDPLDVFGSDDPPRIVPSGNEAMERVRAMQDERAADRDQRRADDEENGQQIEIPAIVAPTIVSGNGGTVEIVVPDVDAMIEEITARATDPNRNPNVISNGRDDSDRSPSATRDDEKKDAKKRNNSRGRSNRRTTPSVVVPVVPPIQPVRPGNGDSEQDCPFANLPEDQRPQDWPFGNC